jgi:integrase
MPSARDLRALENTGLRGHDTDDVLTLADGRTFPQATMYAAAQASTDEHTPQSTKEAFDRDWRLRWVPFCTDRGFTDPAATDIAREWAFTAFVVWLWETPYAGNPDAGTARYYQHETITRALTGVLVLLRRRLAERHGAAEANRLLYRGITAQARDKLAGLVDDWERAGRPERGPASRGKAPAATVQVLRSMVATCDLTTQGAAALRDRALILIGYACALRESESAALLGRDITVEGEGLRVDIRFGKSRATKRIVAVPYGANPATCPVRAWVAWSEHVAIGDEDHAWLRVTKNGRILRNRGLSGPACTAVVTRRGDAAQTEMQTPQALWKHYTHHSLRRGFATDAWNAGVDLVTIARHGGWEDNSKELIGYLESLPTWGERNALANVGL